MAAIVSGLVVIALGSFRVRAQDAKQDESERAVKEGDVPPPALAALKKVANGAPLTEFAEEKEHGQTYYEGTFTGPSGKVDVLVTATGDLVEIEESVAADSVPAPVRAAVVKAAGADAKPTFEKKTVVLYEAHFKKADKGQELVLNPDGRPYEEGQEKNGDKDDDDDDNH
jgi:hypothetical protein